MLGSRNALYGLRLADLLRAPFPIVIAVAAGTAAALRALGVA
jgi:hypothetical protein